MINIETIYLHPRTIKSDSFVSLKLFISGSATTTPGIPPYFVIFASMSPNVLDTLLV